MNPAEFLHELAAQGVSVAVEGDYLAVDGPNDALTPELLAAMRTHKPEILAFLRPRQPDPTPAVNGGAKARRWSGRLKTAAP